MPRAESGDAVECGLFRTLTSMYSAPCFNALAACFTVIGAAVNSKGFPLERATKFR